MHYITMRKIFLKIHKTLSHLSHLKRQNWGEFNGFSETEFTRFSSFVLSRIAKNKMRSFFFIRKKNRDEKIRLTRLKCLFVEVKSTFQSRIKYFEFSSD